MATLDEWNDWIGIRKLDRRVVVEIISQLEDAWSGSNLVHDFELLGRHGCADY